MLVSCSKYRIVEEWMDTEPSEFIIERNFGFWFIYIWRPIGRYNTFEEARNVVHKLMYYE